MDFTGRVFLTPSVPGMLIIRCLNGVYLRLFKSQYALIGELKVEDLAGRLAKFVYHGGIHMVAGALLVPEPYADELLESVFVYRKLIQWRCGGRVELGSSVSYRFIDGCGTVFSVVDVHGVLSRERLRADGFLCITAIMNSPTCWVLSDKENELPTDTEQYVTGASLVAACPRVPLNWQDAPAVSPVPVAVVTDVVRSSSSASLHAIDFEVDHVISSARCNSEAAGSEVSTEIIAKNASSDNNVIIQIRTNHTNSSVENATHIVRSPGGARPWSSLYKCRIGDSSAQEGPRDVLPKGILTAGLEGTNAGDDTLLVPNVLSNEENPPTAARSEDSITSGSSTGEMDHIIHRWTKHRSRRAKAYTSASKIADGIDAIAIATPNVTGEKLAEDKGSAPPSSDGRQTVDNRSHSFTTLHTDSTSSAERPNAENAPMLTPPPSQKRTVSQPAEALVLSPPRKIRQRDNSQESRDTPITYRRTKMGLSARYDPNERPNIEAPPRFRKTSKKTLPGPIEVIQIDD